MGNQMATLIAEGLERRLRDLPTGFHDSFDYTRTGANLCHAITLGLLCRAVESLPHVKLLGLDVRLNRGDGIRFNPDIVAFSDRGALLDSGNHIVYVDFESPNSSDARLRTKNIAPYIAYASSGAAAPYVIVTSLPNMSTPSWELRWVGKDRCNYAHRRNRDQIRANPYRYWRRFWAKDLIGADLSTITMLNIAGRRVRRMTMDSAV
jgi:hypothetical protein